MNRTGDNMTDMNQNQNVFYCEFSSVKMITITRFLINSRSI